MEILGNITLCPFSPSSLFRSHNIWRIVAIHTLFLLTLAVSRGSRNRPQRSQPRIFGMSDSDCCASTILQYTYRDIDDDKELGECTLFARLAPGKLRYFIRRNSFFFGSEYIFTRCTNWMSPSYFLLYGQMCTKKG